MPPTSKSSIRIVELGSEVPAKESAEGVIGVAHSLTPNQVIRVVHNSGLMHIVQRDSLSFESEIATARAMIQHPRNFMDNPIEIILGLTPQSIDLPGLHLINSADEKKTSTLVAFENFLMALSGARTVREQALLIADELYTNATKNARLLTAPGSTSGGSDVIRQGVVEFFAQADGHRLIFGVRDSFGEVGLRKVIERIKMCYEKGVAQAMNHGPGGAGIGSFMAFDSSISYYIGVEMGRRTVVCVALPLGLNRRETSQLAKNIHLLSVA